MVIVVVGGKWRGGKEVEGGRGGSETCASFGPRQHTKRRKRRSGMTPSGEVFRGEERRQEVGGGGAEEEE